MVAIINNALLRAYMGVSNLRARLEEERGQDLIEYAMLGGLVALALIAAASAFLFTSAIGDMATGIGECIDFDSDSECNPF
jgi:Flp pilus assembly pilin Flp